MGILSIFIGTLFLANPFFRMLDFLPDFIGCLLIIAGTTKLALIDGRIESARKYAMYYAVVSAVKIPLAGNIFVSAKDYLLPATFIFSVLEALLMVGIFVSLIGGFQYLLSREKSGEKNLKDSESASIVCFIFSIARAAITFLPEILSLGTQKDNFDYTFSPTPEQDAALLKPYAELLAFAIIGIFGIYFAFICGKFFINVIRNHEFVSALKTRYEKYSLENVDAVNHRKVRFVLLVFFAAILLLFNQILDFVNILPNTLSYLFLIAGTIYLIARLKCTALRATLPVYIPLIALSIHNNTVQTKLLSQTNIDFIYDKMLVRKVPEVLQSTENLPKLILPIIIEYLVLAVLLVIICKSMDNLDFLRDKDTISIFEILFSISTAVYFISSCYVYFGQFIRTANTFVNQKLEVYVKYDSILAIFEWTTLISFILVLYFAYRYGSDLLSRVKAKEDTEY